jgi:PAS domain S-box-containing protein
MPSSDTGGNADATLLAAVVDGADDAIYTISRRGLIKTWNAGAEALFGYTAEEVIGKSIDVLVPAGNNDYASMRDALVRGEKITRYETVRRRKDGALVDVSLTVCPIRRNGEPVGWAAIVRDITESKAARDRMAVLDRLASLGVFAAGIGHEVSNPLAVIMMTLELALLRSQETTVRELLTDAQEAARRLHHVITELRQGTRLQSGERSIVDLCHVLGNVIAENNINANCEFSASPQIEANEEQLKRVFRNILLRAHRATQGSPHQPAIRLSVCIDARGHAVVGVRDEGNPIPRDERRRTFDPVPVKTYDAEDGFALTRAQLIIASLGGYIEAESDGSKGATLTVRLPTAVVR